MILLRIFLNIGIGVRDGWARACNIFLGIIKIGARKSRLGYMNSEGEQIKAWVKIFAICATRALIPRFGFFLQIKGWLKMGNQTGIPQFTFVFLDFEVGGRWDILAVCS